MVYFRERPSPVFVRKVFLVVCNAPLCVDGTTAADNTGQAVSSVRHKREQYSRMDGEVVHPLLCLLDKRVPEDLPCEVLSDAAHLLTIVNGTYGAHRF